MTPALSSIPDLKLLKYIAVGYCHFIDFLVGITKVKGARHWTGRGQLLKMRLIRLLAAQKVASKKLSTEPTKAGSKVDSTDTEILSIEGSTEKEL